MKFDEANEVVTNLLTDSEIEEIYEIVKKQSYKDYVEERLGQQVTDFKMPKSIMDKIIEVCKKISGQDDLVLEIYQFARYEKIIKENNEILLPYLMPHHDKFSQPVFTFDYQIGGNVSWPIVIEGKEVVLSNNEAITFSGTHQVHWRPEREWLDGEYMDMIFCHLYSPSLPDNDDSHQETMLKLVSEYEKKIGWKAS
jgi:hypothetical protein